MSAGVPLSERELVKTGELAELLGVRRETVARMNREGLIPAPIHQQGLGTRYRVGEIRAWLAAGAPPRDRWTWLPAQLPTLTALARQKSLEVNQARSELGDLERSLTDLREKVEREREQLNVIRAERQALMRS